MTTAPLVLSYKSRDSKCLIHAMFEGRSSEPELSTTVIRQEPDCSPAISRGHNLWLQSGGWQTELSMKSLAATIGNKYD